MLSNQPQLSPWHLLCQYVHLTQHMCPPGGFLFLNVNPPHLPLSADRLGSLSKKLLSQLGVPSDWGAHASRGAAVNFYKSLGLHSEQVAQLGKWEDIKTFQQHYLRLQCAQSASEAISDFFLCTMSHL